MNHVNFLDIKPPINRFELNYLTILIVVLGLVAVCLVFGFVQNRRLNRFRAQLEAVANEVAQKNAALGQQKAVAPAEAIAESLNHPIYWSTLLRNVGQKVPASIEFQLLDGSIKDRRTLLIKGVAAQMEPVLLLKRNLESVKECEKIAISGLEHARDANGFERLNFQMECSIK